MDKTKEKVYITRDENDIFLYIWRKISNSKWEPVKIKNCDIVSFQRENKSVENVDCYLLKDFKKKFGFIISPKTKKGIKIDKKLLNSEDYKLFSNNAKRKT